ncbi:hypothetical protein TIFTF001_037710 [Ficus carica]|uniref:Cytochrome P450 n=1 Tax=Ficus carica TaxID=3494 RepID=A0AA88E6R5_FICCA|nr:hypothetical protein TIFTF001_037710 [Ficus carica]
MLRKQPVYRWIHHVMKELNNDIGCFHFRNCHVIVVNSPKIAGEILTEHDTVFASRPETMATQLISGGYLTTALNVGGEQWKKMRRILVSEIVSQSKMRGLLDMRKQEADNLVRFLYNHCSNNVNGEVVNVRTAALHYPANTIRRMMFSLRYFGKGSEDGGPGFEEEEHISSLFAMLLHIYAFCVSDYFPWLQTLDLDGHRKMVCEAMKVVKKYHDPIVNDRFQQWREGRNKEEPHDLLDVLVSLKDSDGNPILSEDEIRAQVLEIFLATVDNPFNTAEWALSEMLNQPKLIEKAVEELDRVVGKDRLLQESDIPHLRYVVACTREALRLHPVAPFNLPHVSTADCVVANYLIPKGSSVLLSRLGLGRNPAVWDDPLQFDPERHLSERHVDLAERELRFISFSRGRRGCVAADLGSNITVMLLGRLLQGFTWNIPKGVEKIDLTESNNSLLKITPLFAQAKPRLNPSVYMSLL